MVALTLSVNFVRSGLGRGLAALAEDEVAAAAMGVDVRRGKIAVFTISAAFASVGGSLFAHYMGTITPDTFGIFASIDFVIMVVVGGLGSLWGSLAGAAFVTILPTCWVPWRTPGHSHGLIVVVVLLVLPRGLVAGLVDLAKAQLARRGSAVATRIVQDNAHGRGRLRAVLLQTSGLTKYFGGLPALHEVGLSAERGQVTALIGPNGQGRRPSSTVSRGSCSRTGDP